MDRTLKEGYLLKEGKALKQQKKRRYVLKQDALYSYKKDREESTRIDFTDKTKVIVDTARNKRKGLYSFSIQNPDKTYILFADDDNSLNDWVRSIEVALSDFKKQPDFMKSPVSAVKKQRVSMMQRLSLSLGKKSTTKGAKNTDEMAAFNAIQQSVKNSLSTIKIGILGTSKHYVEDLLQSASKIFKNLAQKNLDKDSPLSDEYSTPDSFVGSLPSYHGFGVSSYSSSVSSPGFLNGAEKEKTKQHNRSRTVTQQNAVDFSAFLDDKGHVKYMFGDQNLDLEIFNVYDENSTVPINHMLAKCDAFVILFDAFDKNSFSHALILRDLTKAVKRVPVVFAANITTNYSATLQKKKASSKMNNTDMLLAGGMMSSSFMAGSFMTNNSFAAASLADSPNSILNGVGGGNLQMSSEPDDYDRIKSKIENLGKEVMSCDVSTPLELNIIKPFHQILEDINGICVPLNDELAGMDPKNLFSPEDDIQALSRRKSSYSGGNSDNKEHGFIIENYAVLGYEKEENINVDRALAQGGIDEIEGEICVKPRRDVIIRIQQKANNNKERRKTSFIVA